MGDVESITRDARLKWYFIGVRFNIKAPDLDVIEKNNQKDIDKMFIEMIKNWLNTETSCTWRAVYDALRHPSVGYSAVANKLKEWLIQHPNKGLLSCIVHLQV